MSSEPPTSLTGRLAAEAAALRFSSLPPEVVLAAKQCLLDAIGVGLAGSTTEPARLAAKAALEDCPEGPCSILGSSATTNASGAALANGTAMHALDYDDMSVPLCGHPTAPLLPALLALAELSGASGRDLLTAFVAGYEAECRIGAAVDPSHYARGFHATATVGTIGAAVGAGHLLGLDAGALERAIGIAATEAAGLKSMFGTMCKPLHAGRAAASGILAARLARDGFTTAMDALAIAQGFASTLADELDADELSRPYGEPWHVLGNLFKFHAACYFTHGAINAALHARREQLQAERLASAEIRVDPAHLSVCNIVDPTTALEGKFSLRYAAAVALERGSADESCFTDMLVSTPSLVALQQRIEVVGDDSLGPYDTVVTFTEGSAERRYAEHTGRPRWAQSPDEQTPALRAKFADLVSPLLGDTVAGDVAETILGLERADDVSVLRRLLSSAVATV